MSQPIKIEASLEGPLFKNMGTFWTSVFKEQDKVRILLDTALRTRMLGRFDQAVQNCAGNRTFGSLVRHISVGFEANDVIETGTQTYNDPEKLFVQGDLTDYETVYGAYQAKYFALPMSRVMPMVIQSVDRQLVLGVDFFLQDYRFVYFRQDPRIIFPSGSYLVVRGIDLREKTFLSYLTQADKGDVSVVKFLRQAQTPQHFRLALCAVAGMGIIQLGGILRTITVTQGGHTLYTFDNETVRVAYKHEPLVVNTFYPPLTVIGDLIKVVQGNAKQNAWWRQINWRGGMVLDPIVPGVKNLPLPDCESVAYTAGQDAKVHARIKLSEDFEKEKRYWERVAHQETASGFYLNNYLGLPEEVDGGDPTVNDTFAKLVAATDEANALNRLIGLPPEQPDFRSLPSSRSVNPLDVFFESVLGRTAFVLALDQIHLMNQRQVFDFLIRNMPCGCTPVIIGFISGVEDDGANFDDELEAGETISMAAGSALNVEDEVFLDDLVQETVTIMN